MSRVTRTAVVPVAILMLGFVLAGCGSASYRLVKPEETRLATPLEFKAETAGLELALTGLIVYNGAGAWKNNAYWDEYVVRLTNRGGQPVQVEDLVLDDVLDRQVAAGTDPWAIDAAGRKHEAYLKSLGAPADVPHSARLRTQRQLGVADTAKGIAGFGVLGLLYVPGLAPVVAAPAILYGAPLLLIAASPVLVANKFVVDPKNREIVQKEFNRRRLLLPGVIEPGATISGSVFFPVTPGPERLQVRGRGGDHHFEVTLPLPGLEGLHFTYVPDKAALLAARPRKPFEHLRPVPERRIQTAPAGP